MICRIARNNSDNKDSEWYINRDALKLLREVRGNTLRCFSMIALSSIKNFSA
jgi:hypothetical protein